MKPIFNNLTIISRFNLIKGQPSSVQKGQSFDTFVITREKRRKTLFYHFQKIRRIDHTTWCKSNGFITMIFFLEAKIEVKYVDKLSKN